MATDLVTNPYQPPAKAAHTSTAVAAAESRAIGEIQSAMTLAKRFPREEYHATQMILNALQHYPLATECIYSYPRGGQLIEGPSIRLAELIAQRWGNIDFGIIELERHGRESVLQAYAWDLQTNTRCVKTFTVTHERKSGKKIEALEDPRDIYEHTANFGARRMRSAILQIIPRDVIDAAVAQVHATLARGEVDGDGKPLKTRKERVQDLVAAFQVVGVSVPELESFLGRKLDTIAGDDFATLGGLYKTLRDDKTARAKFFSGGDAVSPLNDHFSPGDAPSQPPNGAPAPLTDDGPPPSSDSAGAPAGQQMLGDAPAPGLSEPDSSFKRAIGQLLKGVSGDVEGAKEKLFKMDEPTREDWHHALKDAEPSERAGLVEQINGTRGASS